MNTQQNQCPTCSSKFDPAKSKAMPFCSERCRTIDLGRWLSEDYGVPWERREDELLEEDLQSPN